jgi:hypothetical protein
LLGYRHGSLLVRIGITETVSSTGRVYACIISSGEALLLPFLYTTFGMASEFPAVVFQREENRKIVN